MQIVPRISTQAFTFLASSFWIVGERERDTASLSLCQCLVHQGVLSSVVTVTVVLNLASAHSASANRYFILF